MPDAGKPRLLLRAYPQGQGLEKPVAGAHWKATPATRMMELLHATDVKLGLITNGEQWMLVHAPRGETTTYASWYATIWFEEKITLQAFRSLLSAHRFYGVPDNDTLEGLFARSADNQQEVTDQLGYQVRRAVEVLIQAIDRIDKDRGRMLLSGADETRLYEAALTVMMRLVFLFSAEERGLLLLGDPLYNQNYAVSTLRDQLHEAADQHGEEILERRYDAWPRLLATFRGVYGGIRHDRLQSPPYGGSLFDPDRFPFLEGRLPGTSWVDTPAGPLRINNRTVLHLLEALQVLQVKVPGGGPAEARRLSFRALDIEQIGHVYEGMLDHKAERASEPVLGLIGSKNNEPEVPLRELEDALAKGIESAVEYLVKQTGRSDSTLRRALENPGLVDEQRLRIACDNDADLCKRVRPLAPLLRDDSFDYPVVIGEDSVYVTAGETRRATGTHYTPRSLTEPIVQYTLEPLVYDGPADGKPKDDWKLRSPRELLDLKICDMALGSGAFLVQACRYLSERLVEAWEEVESQGGIRITPEGEPAEGLPEERLLSADPDERLAVARRIIADRCLYGVDKNPMAVEMAKLSLWLVTLSKGKPFTFLDHALKCGDSLLGVDTEQILTWSLERSNVFKLPVEILERVGSAIQTRREIGRLDDSGMDNIHIKEALYSKSEEELAILKLAGDVIAGAALSSTRPQQLKDKLNKSQALFVNALRSDGFASERTLHADAKQMLHGNRPFHWPLEFPEVFIDPKPLPLDTQPRLGIDLPGQQELALTRGVSAVNQRRGFDAIISNPPFQGGKKITGALGTDYREFLVEHLAQGTKGHADLCAYFFLRAFQIIRQSGVFGMLATNTIAQGDTREVGLDQIVHNGGTIIRAIPSQKWPGQANLEVAVSWVTKSAWGGECILQDRLVAGITPFLIAPGGVSGNPYRLKANEGRSFQGSVVLGLGFVMTPDEADALIARDSRNADILFPYLNGEDLNSRPDQSASRWVINFHDWPLNRSASGRWDGASDEQRKSWLRQGMVPIDYADPVAADYPDCLAIVERLVRPERAQSNRKLYRERWWRFAERCPGLYAAIAGMERVLVIPETTKVCTFSFCPLGLVFSHMTKVIAFERAEEFVILASTVHEIWARAYSSTLETRLKYITSDAFETFPFPRKLSGFEQAGERYHAHRKAILLSRQEGLTKTYNRFHNPDETSEDIAELRRLHVEMDNAVAAAYGWTDLDLGHGFHETKQGIRYTISEPARREVLDRLLRLNHERYAEEVEQGLHDKGKKKAAKKAEQTELDI